MVTEQMSCEKGFYAMHVMTRRRSAMLGVLMVGFVGATMTSACGAPTESACPAEDVAPPDTDTATECPAPVEELCMRYRIPLDGNPSMDVALRNKYVAAFGDACYVSEATNAFNCFYKKWQAACADAVKIAEVYGAAPFDKGYTCQPVGNGDYTLQVGPDVANKITIYYEAAPRQTPLIDVDGTPTEINGPYRNLPQLTTVKPGEDFECKTGIVGGDGSNLTQREWILQVNRNANGGKIRSDLAGFTYPCKTGCPEICTEPELLKDPADESISRYDPYRAEVNHEVRKTDKRGCPWGTNANKNAAVISGRLNRYFYNNYPLKNEVELINSVPPYTP